MRWTIAAVVLIVGILLLTWGGIQAPQERHEAARDAGVALIEVAVTIAIIERLMDRSEKSAEVKKVAWNALEELDHAVWVWLGGSRKLDLAELRALLATVADAPVPYFTENLLLRVGSKASHTLVLRSDIIHLNKEVRRGLLCIQPLASLRDGHPLSTQQIADALKAGADHLASALRIPYESPRQGVMGGSSVEWQFWRHFGQWPNKYDMERIEEAARRAPRSGSGEPRDATSA